MTNFIKIKDYDNYTININGIIKNKFNKELKHSFSKSTGYYTINLYNEQGKKLSHIHKLIGIHFIPNPDNKLCIDHIDNNKLNNSIDNLRWASYQENSRNRIKQQQASSIYKGVSFDKSRNKWICQITVNKKRVNLGRFNDELEAVKQYNDYIIKNDLIEFFKLNIL